MIPSREINDWGILESKWPKSKPGDIQQVVAVLNATFPWLSPCKSLKNYWISPRDIDDQRLLKSDWMRGSTGWLHPAKSGSLRHYLSTYLYLHEKNLR